MKQTQCEDMSSSEDLAVPMGSYSPNRCSKLSDCEIGCCKYMKNGEEVVETAPKAICTTSGGEWTKGACIGYSVQFIHEYSVDPLKILTGEAPVQSAEDALMHVMDNIADTTLKQKNTFDIYTCENTVFSKWTVKHNVISHSTITTDGNTKTETNEDTSTFTLDLKSGHTSLNTLGFKDAEISASVTLEDFHFRWAMPMFPPFDGTTKIIQGSIHCQKELDKDDKEKPPEEDEQDPNSANTSSSGELPGIRKDDPLDLFGIGKRFRVDATDRVIRFIRRIFSLNRSDRIPESTEVTGNTKE
jgi:hypothetical protein